MSDQKITDLKVQMAKDEVQFEAITSVVKILLTFLPDEAMKVSASKKLGKAYKHRVKSNRRLLEVMEIINSDRGEDDE